MLSTSSPREPIRVLVVDGHTDYAESLADLARLQSLSPDCVTSLAGAISSLDTNEYDVAVIDQWLPDGRGTEFLAAARMKRPELLTVVVSAFASPQSTLEALTEGAFAYVTKDSDAEAIMDAMRRAAQSARLLRENRRLRATQDRILEAIPDQLLLVDRQLFVVGANRSDESSVIDGRADLASHPLAEVISKRAWDRLDWSGHTERALAGEESEASLTLKEPGGRSHSLVVHFLPITEAPEHLALIRIIDLTDRIELERRLKESESLAKVGRLTAIIAHEIRNPITGIRALAQVLRRSLSGEDAESLDEILSLTSRMSATLADLLTYARPPTFAEEGVDLTTLIEDLVREGRRWPACEGKSLEADPSMGSDVVVRGERDRLFSAFANLIENGLSLAPDGGAVRLSLVVAPANAVLSVEDSGAGVPDEDHERVFEPFFTRKPGGTGLGLSIVKSVIDAHGGAIELGRSSTLGGAAFHVTLPRERD